MSGLSACTREVVEWRKSYGRWAKDRFGGRSSDIGESPGPTACGQLRGMLVVCRSGCASVSFACAKSPPSSRGHPRSRARCLVCDPRRRVLDPTTMSASRAHTFCSLSSASHLLGYSTRKGGVKEAPVKRKKERSQACWLVSGAGCRLAGKEGIAWKRLRLRERGAPGPAPIDDPGGGQRCLPCSAQRAASGSTHPEVSPPTRAMNGCGSSRGTQTAVMATSRRTHCRHRVADEDERTLESLRAATARAANGQQTSETAVTQPCCVASLGCRLSDGRLRVRSGGGMTHNHAGGICVP